MRVFDRLASVVRGGDEVRLSIKREADGHVILVTPVLRDIDPDEKDAAIRGIQALLCVPTRIKVPTGTDADAAVEAYLDGSEHAERASAVSTLDEYTDAIREATNAAKAATAAKAKEATKATAKVVPKGGKAPPPSAKVDEQKAGAEGDDEGADDATETGESDTPADAPAPAATAEVSAAGISVSDLFGAAA